MTQFPSSNDFEGDMFLDWPRIKDNVVNTTAVTNELQRNTSRRRHLRLELCGDLRLEVGMEELGIYLRHLGIQVQLQLVFENQRVEGGPPDVLETLMINLNAPWVTPPKFIPTMKKPDPEHYTTSSGTPITFLKDVHVPVHYGILRDWKAEVIPNQTDSEGWEYNRDFIPIGWVSQLNVECLVRRRKWYRIDVAHQQLSQARQIAQEFSTKLTLLRSFNPYLISNCFNSQQPYRLQFILECQRSSGGFESFSSIHLKSTDPFVWSIAHPEHCFIDPTSSSSSQLYNAHHILYSNTHGANSLHEFIFTLFPNKDANGWEYHQDFYLQQTPWSADYSPLMFVRRRLWFRTITPPQLLYPYRSLFTRYVEIHPRGEIKKGEIQYFSRKKWCYGLMILTDRDLFVYSLENENVPELNYKLQGTEVVAISRTNGPSSGTSSSTASDIDLNSTAFPRTHSLTSATSFLSILSDNSKLFLFTLNQIGHRGKDLGSVGLFNASSAEDLEDWLCAITHQTALIHPIFWPIRFGPPLVDTMILEGELWKKGNFIPNWTIRRFELRQDGTLAYFKGQELRGKIRLRGCLVREGLDETTIEINKNNGQSFVMKTIVHSPASGSGGGTGDEIPRSRWIEALKMFTNQNQKRVVLDDTLVDDEPVRPESQKVGAVEDPMVSELRSSSMSRQSRKARLATVIQKRSLCIRESESPYLPQPSVGLKKTTYLPQQGALTEIERDLDELDLDQPFLEESDSASSSGEEESPKGGKGWGMGQGQEEEDLLAGDLYADIDRGVEASRVSLGSQSSHSKSKSQSKGEKISSQKSPAPSSTKDKGKSKEKSIGKPSSSSPQRSNPSPASPHHSLRSPVAPVAPSVSSFSGAGPGMGVGFSSYEEYVAARKKGVLGDHNPYSVTTGDQQDQEEDEQEENPYSAGGITTGLSLSYGSSYGTSEGVSYSVNAEAEDTEDQETAAYVPYVPSR